MAKLLVELAKRSLLVIEGNHHAQVDALLLSVLLLLRLLLTLLLALLLTLLLALLVLLPGWRTCLRARLFDGSGLLVGHAYAEM
jgi:hypothetical protein